MTGATVIAHPLDAPALPVPVDRRSSTATRSPSAWSTLEVIHLRGHTPGSIALLYDGGDGEKHLFTGDSLFPGGVGNTQKDPERFAQLFTTCRADLRPAARRHLGLSGPRQGHHARRRAPVPPGVAGQRLVTGRDALARPGQRFARTLAIRSAARAGSSARPTTSPHDQR